MLQKSAEKSSAGNVAEIGRERFRNRPRKVRPQKVGRKRSAAKGWPRNCCKFNRDTVVINFYLLWTLRAVSIGYSYKIWTGLFSTDQLYCNQSDREQITKFEPVVEKHQQKLQPCGMPQQMLIGRLQPFDGRPRSIRTTWFAVVLTSIGTTWCVVFSKSVNLSVDWDNSVHCSPDVDWDHWVHVVLASIRSFNLLMGGLGRSEPRGLP